MQNTRVWHWFNHVAICAVTMVLVGCPSTSIFNKYKIKEEDGVTSILIDAKQRAILAVPVPESVQEGGAEQGNSEQSNSQEGGAEEGNSKQSDSKEDPEELPRKVLVCAEPSPDAVSVVTSSLEASVDIPLLESDNGKAVVNKFFENLALSLGSRNTTIQLLRDGLYRQCEAYLNGVINAEEYKKLANRYVDGMVTLLAIERITPDPKSASDSDSDTKSPIKKEGQPSPNEESDSNEQTASGQNSASNSDSETGSSTTKEKEQSLPAGESISDNAFSAVENITRAFLSKNLLERCIKPQDKSKGADLVDPCDLIAISNLPLSRKEREFFLSKIKIKFSDLENSLATTKQEFEGSLASTKEEFENSFNAINQKLEGATTKEEFEGSLAAINQKLEDAATKQELENSLATTKQGFEGLVATTKKGFEDSLAAINQKLEGATTKEEFEGSLAAINQKLEDAATKEEFKDSLATTKQGFEGLVATTKKEFEGSLAAINQKLEGATTKEEFEGSLAAINQKLEDAATKEELKDSLATTKEEFESSLATTKQALEKLVHVKDLSARIKQLLDRFINVEGLPENKKTELDKIKKDLAKAEPDVTMTLLEESLEEIKELFNKLELDEENFFNSFFGPDETQGVIN